MEYFPNFRSAVELTPAWHLSGLASSLLSCMSSGCRLQGIATHLGGEGQLPYSLLQEADAAPRGWWTRGAGSAVPLPGLRSASGAVPTPWFPAHRKEITKTYLAEK